MGRGKYSIPLSLYLWSFAESGVRKTTADKYACTPIMKYQEALELAYDEEMRVYNREISAWKAQKRSIEGSKIDRTDPTLLLREDAISKSNPRET
jgi:hypothetical protein